MPELTITCSLMKDPENADRPVVQIGISQSSGEEAKRLVLGSYLTSQTEIDKQIDDLIRQLESARIDANKFLVS